MRKFVFPPTSHEDSSGGAARSWSRKARRWARSEVEGKESTGTTISTQRLESVTTSDVGGEVGGGWRGWRGRRGGGFRGGEKEKELYRRDDPL